MSHKFLKTFISLQFHLDIAATKTTHMNISNKSVTLRSDEENIYTDNGSQKAQIIDER